MEKGFGDVNAIAWKILLLFAVTVLSGSSWAARPRLLTEESPHGSEQLADRALPGIADVTVAELKDQLEKGLRARRPVEFAFIGRIVDLVEQRKLELKLVMGTFQWARKRDPFFPFPYFERAIRLRAARVGVDID